MNSTNRLTHFHPAIIIQKLLGASNTEWLEAVAKRALSIAISACLGLKQWTGCDAGRTATADLRARGVSTLLLEKRRPALSRFTATPSKL